MNEVAQSARPTGRRGFKAFFDSYAVLTAREIESCFLTPLGYIVLTVSLFLTGITFFSELQAASGNVSVAVRGFLGNSFSFWLILILVPPLITMRLFAEERRSGTIEMLLTAPVSDLAVVLAKFTGSLVFFSSLWIPTILYVAIVKQYGAVPDPGAILATYLGILLLGSFFLAIGCFASSLTTNQIVAAVFGVVVNLLLVITPFLAQVVEWRLLRESLESAHPVRHFLESFSKGVLDSGHIAFYVVFTALLLFLTVRVLEARKWK